MYHRQSFSRMSQTITATLIAMAIALLRPPGAAAQPAHCTTLLPDCGALGFPSPATQKIEQEVHTKAEAATQTWGPASPLTAPQQFRRYIDRLRQLHLPLAAPHMQS